MPPVQNKFDEALLLKVQALADKWAKVCGDEGGHSDAVEAWDTAWHDKNWHMRIRDTRGHMFLGVARPFLHGTCLCV
jgi:hypothetical protein